MKVRPLHDRVLIKRIEENQLTRGGIVIPDTAREKSQRGEVLAVGSGRITKDHVKIEPKVKPGDMVILGKYSGSEFKIDGQELLLVQESEILGILDDTEVQK